MKMMKWMPASFGHMNRDLRNVYADWYNRFLDDDFISAADPMAWNPKLDVIEKDNEVLVKADIPGMDEKNLNVELKENILTISGKKETERVKKDSRGDYEHFERSFGSFKRSVSLPDGIEADQVKAEYRKGVLTIQLPKGKQAKGNKVSIKVA